MAKKILVHGSGHKAASWKETVSCMDGKEELLCPDLCALLAGKTASYPSLYGALQNTVITSAERSICAVFHWAVSCR